MIYRPPEDSNDAGSEPDVIGDIEARCTHAGPLDGVEVTFLAGVGHMLRISAPLALILQIVWTIQG